MTLFDKFSILPFSVIVNMKEAKNLAGSKICQYGKEIKKRLVDIDKTQEWLIGKVAEDTGLFFDSSYLYKVLTGKNNNPKIKASIEKILGLTIETNEAS